MKSFKDIIKKGGVAVIRTDTLYGLVADAKNQHAVDRIYEIKGRDPLKPVVVLVADYDDIRSFDVTIDEQLQEQLEMFWPGKVSIILKVNDERVDTHYIHKGTGGIAFRIPADEELCKLLRDVGPLVAPSANPEGKKPARTIGEATRYFGDKVNYYLDGGEILDGKSSKIIKITQDIHIQIVRE